MNTKALNSLADIICRAQENGRRTPMGIARAIDSAQRHMTPETAAELAALRTEVEQWRATYGRDSLPGALARLERAESRVAELEALKPAAVQTCRVCGAGYSYGEPCSTCAFKARMAAELAERPVNRLTETFMPVGSLRDEDEFGLHHTYRTGRDFPELGGAQ